jgi:hypothetical protein
MPNSSSNSPEKIAADTAVAPAPGASARIASSSPWTRRPSSATQGDPDPEDLAAEVLAACVWMDEARSTAMSSWSSPSVPSPALPLVLSGGAALRARSGGGGGIFGRANSGGGGRRQGAAAVNGESPRPDTHWHARPRGPTQHDDCSAVWTGSDFFRFGFSSTLYFFWFFFHDLDRFNVTGGTAGRASSGGGGRRQGASAVKVVFGWVQRPLDQVLECSTTSSKPCSSSSWR